MSDIEKIADEYFAGKMPRPNKILCDSCKSELGTSHNSDYAAAIHHEVFEWAKERNMMIDCRALDDLSDRLNAIRHFA